MEVRKTTKVAIGRPQFVRTVRETHSRNPRIVHQGGPLPCREVTAFRRVPMSALFGKKRQSRRFEPRVELLDYGIAPERLGSKGFGQTRPIDSKTPTRAAGIIGASSFESSPPRPNEVCAPRRRTAAGIINDSRLPGGGCALFEST